MTEASRPAPRPPSASTPLLGLLYRRKYELLLLALLQHLFVAVALPHLELYARFVWPLSMALLGLLSVGVFEGRSGARRTLRNVLSVVVLVFPIFRSLATPTPALMLAMSLCYVVFFAVILIEVLRYLLRPSYISVDIVSAAICGSLLLLETGIFVMQALYYAVPGAFRGLDTTSFTSVYLDLVYFCSIVVTSIGFGDITPVHHMSKLATSMLGITGQLYSVVLVGILISKYASATQESTS